MRGPGSAFAPVPYVQISGSATASERALAIFNIVARINGQTAFNASANIETSQGDQAGVPLDVVSGSVMSNNAVWESFATNVIVTGARATMELSAVAIVGCSNEGPAENNCRSEIQAGNSINFIENADAFLNVPEEVTVWSPDLNIWNNRWYSPETLAALAPGAGSGSVPAPSTILLFAFVLPLLRRSVALRLN